MDEEEDFETAADNPLAVRPGEVFSPAAAAEQMRALYSQYEKGQSGLAAARQQAMQSMAERFQKAEADLRAQRFGMPSSSEQLFGISQALLSPQRFAGFAGTLDNLVPALGAISAARREGMSAKEEALAKMRAEQAALRERYLLDGQADEQKRLIDLMRVYGPLAKQPSAKTRTGFNPLTGVLTDMETGMPVTPPPPQVGEVRDGYEFLGGDPASERNWRKVR